MKTSETYMDILYDLLIETYYGPIDPSDLTYGNWSEFKDLHEMGLLKECKIKVHKDNSKDIFIIPGCDLTKEGRKLARKIYSARKIFEKINEIKDILKESF